MWLKTSQKDTATKKEAPDTNGQQEDLSTAAQQEQEDGLTKKEPVEDLLSGKIQALKTMTKSWKVAVTKCGQVIIHQAEATYMRAVKLDMGSLQNDVLSLR